MKEHPTLFNSAMVLALLDGRKTQTRRLLYVPTKRVGSALFDTRYPPDYAIEDIPIGKTLTLSKWANAKPGDHIWVKETWRPMISTGIWDLDVRYQADGALRTIRDGEFGEKDWNFPKAAARGNVSPLFMPRWASRIWREITGVRIERLNDCSEADAKAEGADMVGVETGQITASSQPVEFDSYRAGYAELWDSINGAGAWDKNPWVVAVEFKIVEKEEK